MKPITANGVVYDVLARARRNPEFGLSHYTGYFYQTVGMNEQEMDELLRTLDYRIRHERGEFVLEIRGLPKERMRDLYLKMAADTWEERMREKMK